MTLTTAQIIHCGSVTTLVACTNVSLFGGRPTIPQHRLLSIFYNWQLRQIDTTSQSPSFRHAQLQLPTSTKEAPAKPDPTPGALLGQRTDEQSSRQQARANHHLLVTSHAKLSSKRLCLLGPQPCICESGSFIGVAVVGSEQRHATRWRSVATGRSTDSTK